MIRKIFTTLLFSVFALTAMAQIDNGQRIAITPVVSDELPIPDQAKTALSKKLLQMTTQNGFGATSGTFVLTAKVDTVDKIVSSTVPVQIVVELEVSVYVVNLTENFIAAETSFFVKGMDTNDARAQIKAINSLNAKSADVRKFMTSAREKIIDYYSGRITAIMAKAQSCADRGEYDDAIEILAGVPESLAEYPMVAEKMSEIFAQMVDKEAAAAIQEASSKIAVREYPAALEALASIDPTSSHYNEALTMMQKIKDEIDAREKAEKAEQEAREEREMKVKLAQIEANKEMAMQYHKDNVMLEKARIDASRSRATVYVSSSRSAARLQQQVANWLFGR